MQTILRWQQWSRLCDKRRLVPLSRAIDLVSRVVFSASVPGQASIEAGVFFHHSGLGVVINKACVIEGGCEIGVHVVLGGRAPLQGAPRLERDVIVHAGARIIGPVRIGEGSVIAANAVVVAGCAGAMPGRGGPRDDQTARYRQFRLPTRCADIRPVRREGALIPPIAESWRARQFARSGAW